MRKPLTDAQRAAIIRDKRVDYRAIADDFEIHVSHVYRLKGPGGVLRVRKTALPARPALPNRHYRPFAEERA